jgi:thioredoxin 1
MAMVVDAGVAGAMAAPSRQMAAVATASSSSSPCVVGMGMRSLPVCRGLRRLNSGVKVSSRVAVRSASSSSSSSSRGNIVSEAQETVTGGILILHPLS